MSRTIRTLTIGLLLVFSACGPRSTVSSTTPTSRFINVTPPGNAVVTVTVHFKGGATTAEMDSVAKQVSAALSQGTFSDVPDIEGRYEDRTITIAWHSVDAATRGEARVRDLLAGSPVVEKIEVSRS